MSRSGKNALTEDDIRDTLTVWAVHCPNISAASRELGISRSTVQTRLGGMGMRNADGTWKRHPDNPEELAAAFTGPDLADPEKPLDDIIEDATKEFKRRQRAKDTRTWMPFKMKENKPIALVFFGDPHLDECNIPLLREHIDLVNATDGAFGVGMGDYTNNWSGRLAAQIYPVQETTRPQAHKLAEWFFTAILWLVLIKGNHDLWSNKFGTGDVLDWMRRPPESVLIDWQAQFKIVFPNNKEYKIWAAHDFPGRSQMTKAFSAVKRGIFTGGLADLYITADKHCWECTTTEHEHTGRRFCAARARGYKWNDPHAANLGHGNERFGASIVFVMNPTADEPRDKMMFDDVEEGLDYLRFLRAKV